jgi:nucleoside-diphosphate-sugar epimerase
MGAEPVIGDILDAESLYIAARGCDAALHLATAIPRSGNRDWSLNDRIRREGTQNLLAAATGNGVRRYVQQSIVFLYGGSGEELATEDTPVQAPSAVIQSAADMEELVRASALDWCILRGGHFYGPGTGREEGWRQSAREGNLAYPGDGSDFISLVHVVDMARAIVLATESAPARSIYNIVDDEPVSYKQLYTFITSQLGVDAPQGGGRIVLPSLRCSNARAKEELGWQPAYPSYRSGLA